MMPILLFKAIPTPAQAEAGNYKKRKIAWRGLTISVENEKGTYRRGVDGKGKAWKVKMPFAYGYINRTEGTDGDHVDCFIGPNMDADTVYVVHARKHGDWEKYDEDKCMLGFDSKQQAVDAFLQSYTDKRFLGHVTEMPFQEFSRKVRETFDKPGMVKSFDGHRGRQGKIGGSLPRNGVRRQQTETPEFKAWFGDSKVVDAEGNPMVVYHGAGKDLLAFATGGSEQTNGNRTGAWGSYFTPSAKEASIYAEMAGAKEGALQTVYPVYLSIKNPYIMGRTEWMKHSNFSAKADTREIGRAYAISVRKELEQAGHDGIVIRNQGFNDEWVAFHPEQVKSATGNTGEFNPQHQDITKSIVLVLSSGNRYRLQSHQYSFDLTKGSLGPGERWITVHGGGNKDGKGQPVLVRETHHGSGVYHVIGGAGGKLNYLKIRGLKDQATYKQHLAEKQAARRSEKKEQRKRDKESGLAAPKQAAHEQVAETKRQHEKAFISKVAEKLGWDKGELEPKIPEGLSEGAQKKLAARHHSELMQRAKEAVGLQKKRLVADVDARIQAKTGDLPLHTDDPTKLSVADLDERRVSDAGLGFSTNYKKRAEEAGLTEDELQQEVSDKREERQAAMTEEQRKAAINRGETAKLIKEELQSLQEDPLPDVKAKLVSVDDAMELLREHKKLQAVTQKAREAHRQIDESKEDVHAYNLDVGPDDDLDEKVLQDIENDIRTIKTRAFLSEALKNGDEAIGSHVATGAFNSINALAIATGGEALVDRSVVDVLGISGAAQVLARRLHSDMTPDEVEQITEGLQNFHTDDYMQHAEEALKEAHELQQKAEGIKLGETSTGDDFENAMAVLHAKDDAIRGSNKVLGRALGEMEANAAMVEALKQGKTDKPLEVPLGEIALEDAVRRARAIGLQRGDYQVDKVGKVQVLTVTPGGLDRLAKPIDRESIQQIKRNLEIIGGKYDEEDWLPLGVSDRAELGMDLPAGVVPRLAKPFDVSRGLDQGLRDYIGGRAADGDSPIDILADVQSSDLIEKSGKPVDEYLKTLERVLPSVDKDGKRLRAEDNAWRLDAYAEAFVMQNYGGARTPLNRQTIDTSSKVAAEAIHRALAAQPSGVAAYKPIGDLTPQDQTALREYFYSHVAHESENEAALRHELESHITSEPEKEFTDMFGDTGPNPEWADWNARRDELSGELKSSKLDWARYTDMMRGHPNAYAAVQDLIRSDISEKFASEYNKLNPSSPIKVGRTTIRNNLNHLDAVDPKAREERQAKERELVDSLRNRTQGKYAGGAVADKLDAQREQRDAFEQAQMGLFSSEDEPEEKAKPLRTDERHTLGHAAETQLATLAASYGKNFKPGQPVTVGRPTMSGDGIARQRAIKLIEANNRVSLAAGTGSGKTLMQLAAFTHLQQQGKAKRGLFLVPSIVQGEFNGQALKFLEPGKFNWNIQPGASRDERIAAYKNPEHHFAVMTHAAFRDDMLHLGAKHEGIKQDQMRDKLKAMKPNERRDWIKGVMEKEGINFDYLSVDEFHNTLNRAGKENSGMADVIDAFSANTPYFVASSADPVKNDVSEAFDLAAKMYPDRYTDRAAFMRRYANDPSGLKREMARFSYPTKIEPKVRADRKQVKVDLTQEQHDALAELDRHLAKARIARMQGRVDVDAIKAISPQSFEGVPEDQHEAVAKSLVKSIGMTKGAAVQHVIDDRGKSAKYSHVSRIAAERKGKPGVVFAHSLSVVNGLKDHLEKDGHKVIVLTGKDSAEEKSKKVQEFQTGGGILVASDAGSTGANLQAGKWLVQYDTPQTAMAQPLDAKVLTPSGWVSMGSICIGDTVMTPRGDAATVIGVYPQGEKPIVRVTMSDGASTRCTWDHLWVCASRDDMAKCRGYRVRTTEHLARTLSHYDGGQNMRNNYVIPLIGRVSMKSSELPVPPYMLGALLGDGCFCKAAVQFSCAAGDIEIVERMRLDASMVGAKINHIGGIVFTIIGNGDHAGVYPRRSLSPVLDGVRAIGLCGCSGVEKFIPEAYFVASWNDRLELLRGLMDTDGTVDKRNGSASFCTISPALMEGVMALVRSLGGISSAAKWTQSSHKGKKGKMYCKVSISLPNGVVPFNLKRKAQYTMKAIGVKPYRYIKRIEEIGCEETQCIMVDSKEHTYITDDYIVTHNTYNQRNGRIHRIGQQSDIELIDLVANHKAEERARERLAQKYQLRELMTSPLEQLDDTGLAYYLKQRESDQDSMF